MGIENSVNIYDIALHAVFASIGGIVRELKQPEEARKLIHFFAGAFIGVFCGLIVYFLCKNYAVSDYLTASLTGLAGYIGTPVLDLITKIIKKFLTLKFVE